MKFRRIALLPAVLTVTATMSSCAQTPPEAPDWPVTAESSSWNFEDDAPGSIPEGWLTGETNGRGTPAIWAVVVDSEATPPEHAFAITETVNHGSTFNVAIAQGRVYKDLDLSVRVRANTGSEDQGGGPIWRCIDANNYYVCRMNPLEGNFRVYKVVNGRRSQLDSARKDIPAGKWFTIRVTMVGEDIKCYIDDELLLETTDTTLPGPGLVGLWTKSDAATSFDGVEVSPAG